jgi:hypothetical protein
MPSSSSRSEQAQTHQNSALLQGNEAMADTTSQTSRYPKKMKDWPPGGSRRGPVDDYPGLTAIRKDHRLVKPMEVPYTTKSKRRTVKTVQISSQDGGTVGGSRDKQIYASGVLVSAYLGEG